MRLYQTLKVHERLVVALDALKEIGLARQHAGAAGLPTYGKIIRG